MQNHQFKPGQLVRVKSDSQTIKSLAAYSCSCKPSYTYYIDFIDDSEWLQIRLIRANYVSPKFILPAEPLISLKGY